MELWELRSMVGQTIISQAQVREKEAIAYLRKEPARMLTIVKQFKTLKDAREKKNFFEKLSFEEKLSFTYMVMNPENVEKVIDELVKGM
jgi:hypothetical protein